MRKTLILMIFIGIILFGFVQSVSAYASYRYDPYRDRAEVVLSFRDKPYCYSWRYCDRYYKYEDDQERKERVQRIRGAIWAINSFHDRYAMVSGKTSGDVFCQGCENKVGEDFGDREAYDYRDGGRGSYLKGNYYNVKYDPSLE